MAYLATSDRPARAKSVWVDVQDTDLHILYTCPPNCTTEITFLHLVNAGSTNSVTIKWYIAATAYTSNFLAAKNTAAGEYITFSPMRLFLATGDQITVQTTSADHIDVIASAIETFIIN